MDNLAGFDFIGLNFDETGRLVAAGALNELKQRAASATDAIFISHGFRNSEADALDLYKNFLTNLRLNIQQRPELSDLKNRNFVVAGVFWPSKSLPESMRDFTSGNIQSAEEATDPAIVEKQKVKQELQDLRNNIAEPDKQSQLDRAIQLVDHLDDTTAVQDEFADCVRSVLQDVSLEENEGLSKFKSQPGSVALDRLQAPVILPATTDGGGSNLSSLDDEIGGGGNDTGQTEGLTDLVGSVFGAAARFVNLTTWYIMKDRSGTVGANGVADAVRTVISVKPQIKIHLVGHSLGGRLMAACAKALPTGSVASLSLLEAAFSHYGFSHSPQGAAGFFRDVLNNHVVRGPIVATYSASDTVVGLAYALTSRLAGDNTKAVGDENDEYGGIGRNGTQLLDSAQRQALHQAGAAYASLPGGIVMNLNGSGGLITSHGDVTNPAVTWAVASAIATT